MAWTSPMTATANSVLTAAQWNTHVRDNLLETGPAKATTAGRLLVTAGANSIVERAISQASVLTAETTSSQSGTDLATVGPAVTITTGTSALVFWAAQMSNSNAGSQSLMAFTVSGASSVVVGDDDALRVVSSGAGEVHRSASYALVTTLTAGSNTFTAKYWVSGATGTFQRRKLCVVAL